MKNIIIFGASGDTGRYFVKYFINHIDNSDYNIIATGTRDTEFFSQYNIQYIKVDITQKNDFNKLPIDVYAVLDLAGAMPARMKGYNPYKYINTNIIGTLNILEYCRKSNADRILFAQSFGDIKDHSEDNLLLTVNLERKFSFSSDHTIYVMSKNFAVDMLENYHQVYGLKTFIFRLPTIYLYSPIDYYYVDGKRKKIGYRVLIDKALNGEDIEVWGDPTRKKDMVYVKDFCQMLFRALFVNREHGYYNVGSGVGTSLLDQIKGMIEVFGDNNKQSKLVFKPSMKNAPQYIMDIAPAKKELGYIPQYDYISMLKDFKNEMINDKEQSYEE